MHFYTASGPRPGNTVSGEWVVRHGFQAVNLNPQDDAHLDLTIVSYSSGGNVPSSVRY